MSKRHTAIRLLGRIPQRCGWVGYSLTEDIKLNSFLFLP